MDFNYLGNLIHNTATQHFARLMSCQYCNQISMNKSLLIQPQSSPVFYIFVAASRERAWANSSEVSRLVSLSSGRQSFTIQLIKVVSVIIKTYHLLLN